MLLTNLSWHRPLFPAGRLDSTPATPTKYGNPCLQMFIALYAGSFCWPIRIVNDPASLQTRVRPWYAEVRGIYSANATSGDICMAGLGIARCRNTLYAPFGHDLSYVDVWTEALEEWRLCEPSENRWCFGFHHSCSSGLVTDRLIASRMRWPLQINWTGLSFSFGLGHL